MPDEPGVYQLLLHLPKVARVKVGKLGIFLFPAGRYIYTGSALGGLERRLARHQRREKRLHWHIDYFLRYACIARITTVTTRERRECALNADALLQPGARVIVRGFGSSDCRCIAHLVYLGAGEGIAVDERECATQGPDPAEVARCQYLGTKGRYKDN